ncbi:MAG TPA: response regulator transcription factor [Acidimicrobiales bacterium]|nr:response regulator transcription factor [Acidimicrobiales bacterium]
MTEVIRVLLVDDQELIRAGIRRILRPRRGFQVVGECDDGDQVAAAVASTGPDVVVMDARMRRVGGPEATRALKASDRPVPVLVLTTYDDDEVLSAALRAGADGFQLKEAAGDDLERAIRAVAAGGSWIDPVVAGRVLAAYKGAGPGTPGPAVDALTRREKDVLQLVARGRSNSEVAGELYISEVTVKTHLGHILTKLGLRDRAAAIVWAFDHGLVSPGG